MSKELVTLCAWCKKIREGDKWIEKKLPKDAEITHGICDPCADKMTEESEPLGAPEENSERYQWYPLGDVKKAFHNHPIHGWLRPDGEFFHCQLHYRWALKELIKTIPTLDQSEEPGREAYFILLKDGWAATGPGYMMVGNYMTKAQLEKLGLLIIEHAPKEAMEKPWYIDIVTESGLTPYYLAHRQLAGSMTWSTVKRKLKRG